MSTIVNDLVFPDTIERIHEHGKEGPARHLGDAEVGNSGGPSNRRVAIRLLKLALVLATLGVAAWAVAGGIGHVPSLDAVVTAPAVSLCSPIPGDINSALPRIGSRVKAGGTIAEIHDTR
ncbi:MAG: hypothetical protein JWM57_457, partial [Phycisphaerales bacterium]|nr:hypothetical protein [Phycisphaerales bacterium]